MNNNFMEEVVNKSGQVIQLCYQCQKCASGCPIAEFSDYFPNEIIRMIQFGMKERVLCSSFIWLCVNCETCSVRCPNNIKMSEVADALREIAIAEKIPAAKKNASIFHNIFLEEVKNRGRIHETLMMIKYKLNSRDLFSDIGIGLKMILSGKLPLLTKSIKDKKKVRKMFIKTG